MRYTKESFLESLLPMLDNLDLVEKNMPAELKDDARVKGLLMVKTQLEDFLKSNGVEAIIAVSKNFDPTMHEVAQAVEAQNQESGIIIEEIQKGYLINGRLLRPAKVKVAK
jgi:molecular chaperone GrpE